MNEYFEQNKRSLLLLGGTLLLLAIILYFFLVRPVMADYKNEVQRIDDLNEEIELLEAQIENLKESPEEIDVDQLILENKIPSERELDEYILTIQQLELHTDSQIETIDFAYDSSFEIDEVEEEETEEASADEEEALEDELEEETAIEDEADTMDADEAEEEATEPEIDPAILNEKPEDLHVMTVRISALSPNFDEFIELLKLIESNDRISIVTSLEFSKPTEEDIYFSNNPAERISFDAEITTFYYKQ